MAPVALARPTARTLWLPLPDARAAWIACALVAIAYTATMARDLSFYDSAELALAARVGGLGHPTGQPLHTMLGFLASRVPFVPPLVSLAFLSALPSALALLPTVSIAARLAPDASSRDARLARVAVPALCALHAALSEPATRVEVYALASFFALWSVARAMSLAVDASAGSWAVVGLSLGLGASSNPMTAALAGAALGPVVLAHRRPVVLASVTAGGLAGLAPYAYVLAQSRRAASDVFVWGFPGGSHALRFFATGADWAHNTGASSADVAAHVAALARWSASQALVASIALGLAGHVAARFADVDRVTRLALRSVAVIVLALTVLWLARNVIFFVDVPDYLGYLAPALWLCAAGAAALIARGCAAGGRYRVYAATGVVALGASVLLATPSPFARTRAHDRLARTLAAGVLAEAPRDAIVVAASDHYVFPLMYLQQAEGAAPDVVVLPYGLASSSWFWSQLYARHRSLVPFARSGPGGRAGRVARFLAANAGRPVRFERGDLADVVRTRACPDGWFLASGDACDAPTDVTRVQAPSVALASALDRLGDGSPASDGVIAQVAQDRGEALWRAGRADLALDALRAGLPARARSLCAPTRPTVAPPWTQPLPAFPDDAPLGTFLRDRILATALLHAAGDELGARRCLHALD